MLKLKFLINAFLMREKTYLYNYNLYMLLQATCHCGWFSLTICKCIICKNIFNVFL